MYFIAINPIILFLANVPALKEIWIVGDHFLHESFNILQDMRVSTASKTSLTDQLYIYLYYNIVLFFTSGTSQIRSLMARVINSIIEGLNSKERLPKYVLILLDKDLIESLDYFVFGISEALDDCVSWLVKQVNKLFEIRCEDLCSKKPGALSTATERRVIWLAMLHRNLVADNRMKQIYNKKSKFNRALEEAITQHRYHHIMYLDSVVESSHYDSLGKLTARGKTEMWTEIIHQICLFDLEEINLKPRPKFHTGNQYKGAGDNSK